MITGEAESPQPGQRHNLLRFAALMPHWPRAGLRRREQ
jgi:hypothetical protein